MTERPPGGVLAGRGGSGATAPGGHGVMRSGWGLQGACPLPKYEFANEVPFVFLPKGKSCIFAYLSYRYQIPN